MKKIVDSNGEYIVDGDLYLIKTISRHPILWDRQNYDSDMRKFEWLKLSQKLKIKLDWLKKRWSYLREQYVKHLKQINSLESDKPSRRNFKYFKEMSFLANHIQIRKGIYQDVFQLQNVGKPTTTTTTTNDSSNSRMNENENENENGNENENENVDFVITENEIESYNDDDDMMENVFVELSDEDEKTFQKSIRHLDLIEPSTVKRRKQSVCYEQNDKIEVDITEPAQFSLKHDNDVSSGFRITEQEELPTESTSHTYENQQTNNTIRCEDTIFGELVTSMLKKMDSSNRKRAKKEILNILLS